MDQNEKDLKNSKKIRKENSKHLENFIASLDKNELIEDHTFNCSFFIDSYLHRKCNDSIPVKDGAFNIDMFMDYWFIEKALWANEITIKNTAASIKLFYNFMYKSGHIDKLYLEEVESTIKDEMKTWQESYRHYIKRNQS